MSRIFFTFREDDDVIADNKEKDARRQKLHENAKDRLFFCDNVQDTKQFYFSNLKQLTQSHNPYNSFLSHTDHYDSQNPNFKKENSRSTSDPPQSSPIDYSRPLSTLIRTDMITQKSLLQNKSGSNTDWPNRDVSKGPKINNVPSCVDPDVEPKSPLRRKLSSSVTDSIATKLYRVSSSEQVSSSLDPNYDVSQLMSSVESSNFQSIVKETYTTSSQPTFKLSKNNVSDKTQIVADLLRKCSDEPELLKDKSKFPAESAFADRKTFDDAKSLNLPLLHKTTVPQKQQDILAANLPAKPENSQLNALLASESLCQQYPWFLARYLNPFLPDVSLSTLQQNYPHLLLPMTQKLMSAQQQILSLYQMSSTNHNSSSAYPANKKKDPDSLQPASSCSSDRSSPRSRPFSSSSPDSGCQEVTESEGDSSQQNMDLPEIQESKHCEVTLYPFKQILKTQVKKSVAYISLLLFVTITWCLVDTNKVVINLLFVVTRKGEEDCMKFQIFSCHFSFDFLDNILLTLIDAIAQNVICIGYQI